MENLRGTYTYPERLEFQHTLNSMKQYIRPLLMRRQAGKCALCPVVGVPFDIDHLVYNPRVTLSELRLLCWPCHKRITYQV